MHYPDQTNLTPELNDIVAGKRHANVYKMLMHTPNLAPSFTMMADAVMWSKSWPSTWRELAIVRVGHLSHALYEVHHHERIGRMVGLTEAQLSACASGADQIALSEDERTILRLTDAIVYRQTLTNSERNDALRFLSANQFADFVLTVGFYQMVSNFLNIFRIDIEEGGLSSVEEVQSD